MTILQLAHALLDAFYMVGTPLHHVPACVAASADLLLGDGTEALRSGALAEAGITGPALTAVLLAKPIGTGLAVLVVATDE
jgi:hypothetical protein